MAFKMKGSPMQRNFASIMDKGKKDLWGKAGFRPEPDYAGGDTTEKSGTVRRGQQELSIGPFNKIQPEDSIMVKGKRELGLKGTYQTYKKDLYDKAGNKLTGVGGPYEELTGKVKTEKDGRKYVEADDYEGEKLYLNPKTKSPLPS